MSYQVSAGDPVWDVNVDAAIKAWAIFAKANGITAANFVATVTNATDAQVATFVRNLVKNILTAT